MSILHLNLGAVFRHGNPYSTKPRPEPTQTWDNMQDKIITQAQYQVAILGVIGGETAQFSKFVSLSLFL